MDDAERKAKKKVIIQMLQKVKYFSLYYPLCRDR